MKAVRQIAVPGRGASQATDGASAAAEAAAGAAGAAMAAYSVSAPATPQTATPAGSDSEGDAAEDEMALDRFRLSAETVGLLRERGIARLFPIQAATLDHILDGRDVVAQARTSPVAAVHACAYDCAVSCRAVVAPLRHVAA